MFRSIPSHKRSDHKDHAVLKSACKAVNAEIEYWYRAPTCLEVSVKAPTGFIWASNHEEKLQISQENNAPSYTREAVTELIDAMDQGYERSTKQLTLHDSTCECDACEHQDNELEELDFV